MDKIDWKEVRRREQEVIDFFNPPKQRNNIASYYPCNFCTRLYMYQEEGKALKDIRRADTWRVEYLMAYPVCNECYERLKADTGCDGDSFEIIKPGEKENV